MFGPQETGEPWLYVGIHIIHGSFLSYGMNKKARMFLWREYTRFMYDMFLLK